MVVGLTQDLTTGVPLAGITYSIHWLWLYTPDELRVAISLVTDELKVGKEFSVITSSSSKE